MRNSAVVLSCFIMLLGCMGVETDDPEKAYKYWSGSSAPEDVELLEGTYWRSPHFTLEHELFLKMKCSHEWASEFIKQNGLYIDTVNADWKFFTEVPDWFSPNSDFLKHSKNTPGDRSVYFYNQEQNLCYIYETVGM